MRYAEALAYLKEIQGENCKLSLDNIQRVIERVPFAAGNIRYVQVAGTNGKGSTAHFIAAILRAPAGGWGSSPRRTCRTCASASRSTAG